MTSICLVRHGETMWNREKKLQGGTDIPLNDKGIEQARQCRDYLKDDTWDVLVTSPLQRARHTAEIIREAHDLPLTIMEEFRERNFGEAEGMREEERLAAFPDKQYPGQEDKDVFINRVMAGVRQLAEKFPEQRILLVAHGAVINAILTEISGGTIGADRFKLLNGCLTNIEYREGHWEVHDYNQVTHLS